MLKIASTNLVERCAILNGGLMFLKSEKHQKLESRIFVF